MTGFPAQDPARWQLPPPDATQAQWPVAQPPAFFDAPPSAPLPKRGRTGLYIGAGAGAVLVAGVVAAVVAMSGGGANPASAAQGKGASSLGSAADGNFAGGGPGASATPNPQVSRDLVVPLTAGPLRLLLNADTEQRANDLKRNLSANNAYPDPQVGFYRVGSTGSYSVWMLAQSITGFPQFQSSLGTLGVPAVMKQITESASMKDVTVENPGQLGGALDCGKLTVSSTVVRSCVWVDPTTVGWVYFVPSVNQSKLVTYTQDLRAAAEHGS